MFDAATLILWLFGYLPAAVIGVLVIWEAIAEVARLFSRPRR